MKKGEYPSSEFNDARIVDRDEMEWFEGIDYSIEPCSEQLVGKKVTYYFDNLQRVVNERYEYLPGTNLITTKVISDGTDSIKTEFSYNDCFNTDIDMKMKARNICGIVTGIRETFEQAPLATAWRWLNSAPRSGLRGYGESVETRDGIMVFMSTTPKAG